MTASQLITSTYPPDDRRCIKFNDYFMNYTWLSGNYLIAMWNQFRSGVQRTNNSCEGYNSRLAKRALQPHMNIYVLIRLFQAEQVNKEAYILQLESGQQPVKRRKQYSQVDNDLVKYGLEYMSFDRDLYSYLSVCSHAVNDCWK